MTYLLGPTSQARMAGVHPDLVRVALHAIQITSQDFAVTEGVRSAEEEAAHVANGTSHTMNSMHLPQRDGFGHALDLVPWVNGALLWALPAIVQWNFIYPVAVAVQTAAIAEKVRIRWGGVWDRTLNDLPLDADALKKAVSNYCVRHVGPDLLDGPHYEIHA